ncbi:MAG: OmpA family protein [Bacteroidota bacterium]
MRSIIILFAIVGVFLTNAQERKIKRANEDFKDFAYMDAIASYEELVGEGLSDEDIYKKLGNSNYVNARYKEASNWYAKLIDLKDVEIDPEYYYRYAQSLKSIGEYGASDKWMRTFKSLRSDDQRALQFLTKSDYLERIKANSGKHTVKNLTINSSASDFAPSFYGASLVFSTARDTGITAQHIHEWNDRRFLNLHTATIEADGELTDPKRFTKNLNTKTHESSSVFTKDGNTLYFTRNNSKSGKFARDDEGISRLKIFRSDFVDGAWQDAVELPFNGAMYSVAHPALSADEKFLFFSSDMPGSLGASDLFKVAIQENGGYGTPENLGTLVNTEARESFPFVDGETLYFSSDGHPGLGGLDVFAVKIDDSSEEIINLAEPINSQQDDFSYVVNDSKGYFASNRPGGVGSDDIYSFIQNEPLSFECNKELLGLVRNKENGAILPNALVNVLNEEGTVVAKTVSGTTGEFNLTISCTDAELTAIGSKTDFDEDRKNFRINQLSGALELLLQPNTIIAKGSSTVPDIALPIIYFDFDKDAIRADARVELEKVLAYMNQYPSVTISIKSHTDSRANQVYNNDLAERRAKSTRDYLIQNGIAAERLLTNSYGELQLTNNCADGQNCSKGEHQLNRRSEFSVVKK